MTTTTDANYTTREAMEYMGCCYETLWRRMKRGNIAFVTLGGRILIDKASLHAAMAAKPLRIRGGTRPRDERIIAFRRNVGGTIPLDAK